MHYARYYKLIALAILISTAVIVGSLLVGDSVRGSLEKRVGERLGDTRTIISTQKGFLDVAILNHPLFGSSSRGILLMNGFVSSGEKLLPVMVWGVSDLNIPTGSAILNKVLVKELGLTLPEDIVLRLPAKGLVPSGSLFVTQNYSTGFRLKADRELGAEEGGNLNLKNEQTLPLNLFMNREELERAMDLPGKINLILSSNKISADSLKKVWNFRHSGLKIEKQPDHSNITSDRVFLEKELVGQISTFNAGTNRIFSYLVNDISSRGSSVPYSFVTACDSYKNEKLLKDEIILSDYTALRLQATVGDSVSIRFFVSKDFKTLQTDSAFFRVKRIVPIASLQSDKILHADFPGISDVERCTEWDSDLPINMDLIRKEDERYWEIYRSTPKALLAYESVADSWGNAYGTATAIQIPDSFLDSNYLTPELFGIQVTHPLLESIFAAKNGVDFTGLFMALGFFIIVSALLLMLIPLSEMLFRRKEELKLLKFLGYPHKRIRAMLWKESIPIVLIASVLGVVAGLIYTGIIMWLLGSFWKGATHTEGFSVYPNGITLVSGLTAGALVSFIFLYRGIAGNLKNKKMKRTTKKRSLVLRKYIFTVVSLTTLILVTYNLLIQSSVGLFALSGVLLMLSFALYGDYVLHAKGKPATDHFTPNDMIFRTIYANRRQNLLAYFSLAFGIFIVFSVGLNRKGFSDPSQMTAATAGYSLWCESSIPVYHNVNSREGREKLNLQDLPENLEALQFLRYNADEASCLNLNKVSRPNVLGVDLSKLLNGPLYIQNNIFGLEGTDLTHKFIGTDVTEAPALRSERDENAVPEIRNEKAIPALIDATVLEWSLMKNLGDTLYYRTPEGKNIAFLLAGTLPNTVFQGSILIDRQHFDRIWPEITGSEIMLLKIDPAKSSEAKELVSRAMNEYGMRISTTSERLKLFNSVTDTYLTIFLSLGGIGLLLGIFAFVIVIRKNLSTRQAEIELYGTLGFSRSVIQEILYRENRILPLYAISTGVLSAVLSVGTQIGNISLNIWATALTITILSVIITLVFVRKITENEVIHKEY